MKKPLTIVDQFRSTPEGNQRFNQEALILEVTEAICETMQKRKVSHEELARRLAMTPKVLEKYVLGQNLTLHRIANIFTALDSHIEITVVKDKK